MNRDSRHLDISMPKLDGLEVISRISALGMPSKILVSLEHLPDSMLERVIVHNQSFIHMNPCKARRRYPVTRTSMLLKTME